MCYFLLPLGSDLRRQNRSGDRGPRLHEPPVVVGTPGEFPVGTELRLLPGIFPTGWGDHDHADLTDSRKSARIHAPRLQGSHYREAPAGASLKS